MYVCVCGGGGEGGLSHGIYDILFLLNLHTYSYFTEDEQGRPPIKVKFEIPYFTVSGIQVGHF